MFKKRLFIAGISCILMMSVLQWQGAVLKTAQSPRAIVDLEFAQKPEQVQALMAIWMVKDIRINIQLDFLFIVAYVAFLAIGAVAIAKKWTVPLMQNLGWLMARLALLAGLLDVAENLMMLQTIGGHYSDLSLQITHYCALIKFSLVGLVLVYLLLSIPILFKKSSV
jgi:hypothetical protein